MKTLKQINKSLETFENKYKIPVSTMAQGSPEWLRCKLGVISASNISKVVAKKDSETRNTYMCELVAQVCTGQVEEINSKYLAWGKMHEDAARAIHQFTENAPLVQIPFVFLNNDNREGCSPDSVIEGVKGVEIKCPFNPVNYIKFLVSDKVKKEYELQCQYSMRILDCDKYDIVQYHPEMKKTILKSLNYERDANIQNTFSDAVPQFIDEMDKMLSKIGIEFGAQWT